MRLAELRQSHGHLLDFEKQADSQAEPQPSVGVNEAGFHFGFASHRLLTSGIQGGEFIPVGLDIVAPDFDQL